MVNADEAGEVGEWREYRLGALDGAEVTETVCGCVMEKSGQYMWVMVDTGYASVFYDDIIEVW